MKVISIYRVFALGSFLFLNLITISAQIENEQNALLKKNSIYGGLGYAVVYGTYSGFYERILKQNNRLSSFIKVGYGAYALAGSAEPGKFVLAQYGIMMGRNKHHLELGAGPNWYLNGELQSKIPFSATIGWRLQEPEGFTVLRAGISWPESIYFGFGVAF